MLYKDFLVSVTTCPFCEFRDRIIAENDGAFLTYAVAPYHPDHLLVVPKKHLEHIVDIESVIMHDITEMQRVGIKILNKLGHKNISVLVKEGDTTEKSIAHTHYHIIPDIILESSDHLGFERKVLGKDEVDALMARIESVK